MRAKLGTPPAEKTPPSPLRVPLTVLLGVTVPPFALVAWILLSGSQRQAYLQSGWVRTGGAIVLIGTLPLLAIGLAVAVGLWPDPNPNPIGPGLLLLVAGTLGFLCALVGVLGVASQQGA